MSTSWTSRRVFTTSSSTLLKGRPLARPATAESGRAPTTAAAAWAGRNLEVPEVPAELVETTVAKLATETVQNAHSQYLLVHPNNQFERKKHISRQNVDVRSTRTPSI